MINVKDRVYCTCSFVTNPHRDLPFYVAIRYELAGILHGIAAVIDDDRTHVRDIVSLV